MIRPNPCAETMGVPLAPPSGRVQTAPNAPAPSDACYNAEAAARGAPAGKCSRPWSQRAEQFGTLRPSGREAATAAAAASAAASALSASAHRYHLAQQQVENGAAAVVGGGGVSPEQRTTNAYASSPSHSSCPAWRLTHKPRTFARSFSAGPLRDEHGRPTRVHELGEAAARATAQSCLAEAAASRAGGGGSHAQLAAAPSGLKPVLKGVGAMSSPPPASTYFCTQRHARTTGCSEPRPFPGVERTERERSAEGRRPNGSFEQAVGRERRVTERQQRLVQNGWKRSNTPPPL